MVLKAITKVNLFLFITYEDNGFGNYTQEAKFRQYPTYKESMEDYAKLLKNGLDSNKDFYHGVWKTEAKSYKEATRFNRKIRNGQRLP